MTMKLTLNDGYIEMHDKGNTFLGETAHKIMYAASKVSRKANVDFNSALEACIKAAEEKINRRNS